MFDIRIQRRHALGLAQARKVAWRWAEEVEQRFDMVCTIVEGEREDVVEFTRIGVQGTMRVAADLFELEAKLGFLLGAFAKSIEAEIEKNLDALLAKGSSAASAAKKK